MKVVKIKNVAQPLRVTECFAVDKRISETTEKNNDTKPQTGLKHLGDFLIGDDVIWT